MNPPLETPLPVVSPNLTEPRRRPRRVLRLAAAVRLAAAILVAGGVGGLGGAGLGLRAVGATRPSIPLAGAWRFELDRADRGTEEGWYRRELTGVIQLPGSLQEQGFGDPPGLETPWMGDLNDRTFFTEERYAPYRDPDHFKFPYWLTPTRYYAGVAWYQRDVDVPPEWEGRRVVVHLERPHWETRVWWDDHDLGAQNSLATPHEYEVREGLTPGRHRLTVRVDNRYVIPVGVNSHSVSDHTQGNWNGLTGDLRLTASPRVWIEDLQVYPDRARQRLTVRGRLGNRTGPGEAVLDARFVPGPGAGTEAAADPVRTRVTWTDDGGAFEFEVGLRNGAPWWDEFRPALHRLVVTLRGHDERELAFGLREVSVLGRQIAINGRRVFLRGTLECCIFPLTGYPPTTVEAWRRILQVCRDHGLNHLRFHSWTPPRAAFEAADEAGFYLYVECPTWANGDTSVGDGRPVDAWIHAEGDRILQAYGNHPSFILMSYGNEPGGRNQRRWLGDLVRQWQGKDPRRLYTSGAGWPMIPENDVHVTPNARAYPVRAQLGETAGDYRDFLQQQTAPVISHEIGQYCVFPNLDEIPKYTGWLQARNFEIVRDFLEARGMRDQAGDFLRASGRLQTLFYKDEIEACLRTPGWAGFELLDLHDFPGQGTALVGILDPFWDGKGYVTPAAFRRFCADTVTLARLPKRIWTANETFRAPVEVAHFGASDLGAAVPRWRVHDAAGAVLATGEFPAARLTTGQVSPVGTVEFPLSRVTPPAALRLEVVLDGVGGADGAVANDWAFWVYPGSETAAAGGAVPEGVTVVHELGDEARAALERGARVVLLVEPRRVRGNTVGRFDPIFWNKMWFPSQPQHTLGLWMDPGHPLLERFPTSFHADWQWQDLQNRSKPMILDGLPRGLRPLVQVIDDWNTCRKLGLAFEARVGQGALLACSIDVERDLAGRPAARQFRDSLLRYAAGPRFQPRETVTFAQLEGVFRELTAMEKLGVRVWRCDSEQPGYEAANVLDDDPATLWHSRWGDGATGHPHALEIALNEPATVRGLSLLPRQDGNRNGWIRGYAVHVSADRRDWGEPVAAGEFTADASEKRVPFGRPETVRYLRLVARSGFDAQPFTSLAELRLWLGETEP